MRAQAVAEDGTLLDDFWLDEAPNVTHVRNAPSPAATSSLALAKRIADAIDERRYLQTVPGRETRYPHVPRLRGHRFLEPGAYRQLSPHPGRLRITPPAQRQLVHARLQVLRRDPLAALVAELVPERLERALVDLVPLAC